MPAGDRQPVKLSWQALAGVLAERMSHHVYCPDHREAEAEDRCPFCRDRAAYRLWQAKAGHQDPPPYTGASLNVLHDYNHRTAAEAGED